jgi:hypothetical protein
VALESPPAHLAKIEDVPRIVMVGWSMRSQAGPGGRLQRAGGCKASRMTS